MRVAVKPQKFKKLRSMLSLSNKGKASTYLLRDEMEVIVYSITGNRIECKDTGSYFYKNLAPMGFKKQVTIDSHPTMENVNFLISAINKKRKEEEGNVIASRSKKNRGVIKNLVKSPPANKKDISVRVSKSESIELDLNQVLIQKILDQKLDTLSFDGTNISITFK